MENLQTKLSRFVSAITKQEGGKSSVKVGDVRQLLKLANKRLNGALYKMIELAETKPEDLSC